MRDEILVGSDYERKGDVFFFDKSSLKWIGHPTSKSKWNVYITACLVLQAELTKRALQDGHDYEIFYPRKQFVKTVTKTKKIKKVNKSDTFISLF